MRVGFIGWRGMVGSVLMQRMHECGDFEGLEPTFFSTSAAGSAGPTVLGREHVLQDAFDIAALKRLPVLVSCQGGSYTADVYPRLRAEGWDGYFIDAARQLRMEPDTVLVLDPVNGDAIRDGLRRGVRTFCGANCTVSLMLMALHGLLRAGEVQWVSSMTYQAASGAGAAQMRELVAQMAHIAEVSRDALADPAASALEVDAAVARALSDEALPTAHFGTALAGSLIPWIDEAVAGGRTREEWKAGAEGNKILGSAAPLPFDGLCVRVGSMRCHAQGLTVKLARPIPLDEVNELLGSANDWVKLVANRCEQTVARLSPAAVSGSLDIAVGRVRKLAMGDDFLTLFTVGDQLLWGAAEPLRRMLVILRQQSA